MIDMLLSLARKYIGCGYWWGAKGVPGTWPQLNKLIALYGRSRYYFTGYSAERWLGKEMCFDCSGLVTWLLQQLKLYTGSHLSTWGMIEQLGKEISKRELRPGDLVYTQNLDHVGIYAGNDRVIHARSTFYGVQETALFSSFTRFQRLKCLEGYIDMQDKIKDFQSRYGLPQTGIPDAATKAKAAEVLPVINHILQHKPVVQIQKQYKRVFINGIDPQQMPVLRQGSRGDVVRYLQTELTEMGYYNGRIDGDYGPMTFNAVLSLQNTHGLIRDGIAGRQVWTHILTAHVMECDPMNLKNEIVKKPGNQITGDFINSAFFWGQTGDILSNVIQDGRLLAKQWIVHPHTKQQNFDMARRGIFIVDYQGNVDVKMVVDVEKELDIPKIKFAISGFNLNPLTADCDGWGAAVSYSTWRSMLGYSSDTGIAAAVVMPDCSAQRGARIMKDLGYDKCISLDSGLSTNARFDGSNIRLTSRTIPAIIRFG